MSYSLGARTIYPKTILYIVENIVDLKTVNTKIISNVSAYFNWAIGRAVVTVGP